MKLRMKMLFLVIIPLICLGGITYVVGSVTITSAMTDTIQRGLRATAISTRDAISTGIPGAFRVDENGEMWKGETLNVSQHYVIADDVKNATGMEVTVFFGDTRYMTSVKGEDGNRVIGTKASGAVVDAVLGKGEEYFAQNVDVVGEKFFAFYVPLFDEGSSKPVGMVFTGMSQEQAEGVINSIIFTLLGIIVATVVIIIIVAWFVANNFVKGIKTGVAAVDEVSKGNLTIHVDQKYLNRKDEIGDLAASVARLKNELVSLIGQIADKSGQVHEESQMLSKKADNTADMVTQVEKAVEEIATGATYQAARAGEQGRGFAVVAGQIQKLAEQSDESARQIEAITNSLIRDSEEAVETMNEVQEIMKQQTRKVDQSEETFGEVKMGIDQSIASIKAIADRTSKLDTARARVVDGVQNLSAIAQENAASTQETSASVTEVSTIVDDISTSAAQLRSIADELKQSIDLFRL